MRARPEVCSRRTVSVAALAACAFVPLACRAKPPVDPSTTRLVEKACVEALQERWPAITGPGQVRTLEVTTTHAGRHQLLGTVTVDGNSRGFRCDASARDRVAVERLVLVES